VNLDLMEGLLEGIERSTLEARLDPAPGRCCVVLSETTGDARAVTRRAGSTTAH